jgi:hypothetical protein
LSALRELSSSIKPQPFGYSVWNSIGKKIYNAVIQDKMVQTKTKNQHGVLQKMAEKKLDWLSLYAGLDITYPTTSQREASICQGISCFFKKTENTLARLQPTTNRNGSSTIIKTNTDDLCFKRENTLSLLSRHDSSLKSLKQRFCSFSNLGKIKELI